MSREAFYKCTESISSKNENNEDVPVFVKGKVYKVINDSIDAIWLQDELGHISNITGYVDHFKPIANMFCGILDEMIELSTLKNADYEDSFDKLADEFGIIAPTVRISDKTNRLKTIVKNNGYINVKTESIRDTLLDLANYAVMTIVWLDKQELEEC